MIAEIPISALLVQDGEPPLHLPGVLALVSGERQDGRPLEVEPIPETPFFRILNGRHRFVAALVEQRATVRCEIKEPTWPKTSTLFPTT
jgi:hypothetical protein